MKQTLWLKLGSIAVHAEELISPGGHEFDREAIRGLLADPEVRRFLDAPANKVYLPRKRSEDKVPQAEALCKVTGTREHAGLACCRSRSGRRR